MQFETFGDAKHPAVLFFHAMGVTGASSEPVARFLQDRYFCILPTSSVYCAGARYAGKEDEVRQVEEFLRARGITELALLCASSLGADLALAFLTKTKCSVSHVYFDGGQFAQIARPLRRVMVPFLYFAIKSLWWSKGKTLKKILWCDDASIKPYFVEAGHALRYRNLRTQIMDSLEDKPFPALPDALQAHTFFAFGSAEEHFKYRSAVQHAYPGGHFPVFEGCNHMQYQIQNPQGFAQLLESVIEQDRLPLLLFVKDEEDEAK